MPPILKAIRINSDDQINTLLTNYFLYRTYTRGANTLPQTQRHTHVQPELTFSAEFALLLAGGAGRALAGALVLAFPACQHFSQPPQGLEGNVVGRESTADARHATAGAAHVHKPQVARSRAGCTV